MLEKLRKVRGIAVSIACVLFLVFGTIHVFRGQELAAVFDLVFYLVLKTQFPERA